MGKLYYLGKPADGFGWGVANTNLVRELSKLCDVIVETSDRKRFDAPVFVPIADHSLTPIRKVKSAPKVIGYCFTEWPIAPEAVQNAKRYDVIFAGSAWNVERLVEKGISSKPLIQGVDFERFTPQPPSERKGFVVLSGGKFEYRKGQDMVIAAMRRFMDQRKDAVLITSWHNPWPQSVASMANSPFIDVSDPFKGLPMDRVIQLPPVPNEKLPAIYQQAHIGLFPNRCEAGTNLVMSEFMACQRPVIASYATGQKDVLGNGSYLLRNGSYDPAGWFNPPVSDILHQLENAYQHREELINRGALCRQSIEPFTWRDCAAKIVKEAFSVRV
jgi:glycosyltransferase involved in cell wall biosynthesis